jgi:hypothetical protein
MMDGAETGQPGGTLMSMVRFVSDAGAPVTMSDELARRFIRMTGHHDSLPGAIVADDIPAALASLRRAVAMEQQASDEAGGRDEDDDEPQVSLSTRAFPLLRLLEAAARRRKDLLWERFDGVFI